MKFKLSHLKFSRFDLKRNLKLPRYLNKSLAEDIGIMIGDGHISKMIRPGKAIDYQIGCYGDSKRDGSFYGEYVKNLKKNLFNLDFRFSQKQKNTCELRINSKGLLEFYTKIIKLPLGKKGNVKIPLKVMKSKKSIKSAFIRGLFDSDGSFQIKRNNYPVIKLKTYSENLVNDCNKLLKSLGIISSIKTKVAEIHSITKKEYITNYLYISGREKVRRYINLIGFSNPKNISKLKEINGLDGI